MDPEKKHGLNEEEHIVDMEKLREEIPELREEENVLGRIARYFIKKNRVVIMMIILVLIWGVGSYTSLKRELNPEIVMPYGYIMTTYMGAGPEEMEKLVTDKLESKVSTISEIKKVTSGSSYGFSGIFVEFEQGVDIDKK
ncbi:MAG TPA: efflux RND transporter permease subunit [Anaerovoracaceae bacterium]|nr:efflux RND transporter permease subunit [Anaerovoracaceae bacterium]